MTPVSVPCSQNAHDETVLVRCAQSDRLRGPFPIEGGKLGREREQPDPPSCSPRPHDQKVLPRCVQ